MADYMSDEEQSPPVPNKRKKTNERQWTDSEVRDLIYMWQQEECLYNTQNKDYHNSTKRNSALERISVEIQVPVKELSKKMVGLRSYYGQLKQKVNSSKKSGAGTDEIFQPQWPFYDDMDSFLKDFVTPRPTESNLEKTSRGGVQSQKGYAKKQSATTEDDDIQLRREVMVKALHKLDDSKSNQERSVHKETPDDLFGKLIGQSIAGIPEGYRKEVLKVQIQQMILQTKFMTSQQNTVNANTMQSFGSPPENATNNVHSINRFDSSFRTYEHF